jgi:hypothetical protein
MKKALTTVLLLPLLLTSCDHNPSEITVYTRDDKPIVVTQTFDTLVVTVRSNRVGIEFISHDGALPPRFNTNSLLVEDETIKVEVKK